MTDWVIIVTSVDNPTKESEFRTIFSTTGVLGTYEAGPFSDNSEIGTYIV
jgi:hypothetical protein